METAITLNVPCKINLHLAVGPRRLDGFHDIGSIFLALDWGDILHFSVEGPSACWSLAGGEPIPVYENLVSKAVTLFREASGDMRGLACRLEKRVPPGSGLGGGSADAAYTLLACNRLCGNPLSHDILMKLATRLGSDVPFFLHGPCAWVEGRGELIHPLDIIPTLCVLLVIPPVHSNTGQAFSLLDRAREEGLALREAASRSVLVEALHGEPSSWPFFNDFYAAFLREDGDPLHCVRILDALKALGASFSDLSGSGSACFGVFPDALLAAKAARQLSVEGNICRVVNPLARGPNTVVQ